MVDLNDMRYKQLFLLTFQLNWRNELHIGNTRDLSFAMMRYNFQVVSLQFTSISFVMLYVRGNVYLNPWICQCLGTFFTIFLCIENRMP